MDEMDENVLNVILNFDLFQNFLHISNNEMMVWLLLLAVVVVVQQNIYEYENYIVYPK
jgi:hypothetical protein